MNDLLITNGMDIITHCDSNIDDDDSCDAITVAPVKMLYTKLFSFLKRRAATSVIMKIIDRLSSVASCECYLIVLEEQQDSLQIGFKKTA